MIEAELISKTNYNTIERFKVEGGHIYRSASGVPETGISEALCFVPDVDLTRYQAHLRDAYNQGFKDGQTEPAKQAACSHGFLHNCPDCGLLPDIT